MDCPGFQLHFHVPHLGVFAFSGEVQGRVQGREPQVEGPWEVPEILLLDPPDLPGPPSSPQQPLPTHPDPKISQLSTPKTIQPGSQPPCSARATILRGKDLLRTKWRSESGTSTDPGRETQPANQRNVQMDAYMYSVWWICCCCVSVVGFWHKHWEIRNFTD